MARATDADDRQPLLQPLEPTSDGVDKLETMPQPQRHASSVARRGPTAETPTYGEVQAALGSSFATFARRFVQGNDDVRTRFQSDVARVQQRLLGTEKRGPCGVTMIEERGHFAQVWDLVTLLSLLFTLTVTPYEVALLEPAMNALLFFNQFITAIFLMDMVVTLHTPYMDASGVLVKEPMRIAWRYLQSWFMFDLLSCVPFDLLLLLNVFGDIGSKTEVFNPALLRWVRIVRLLRLVRMAKVLRASRILVRWESRISLAYTLRTLVQWTLVVVLMVHWFSCLWAIEATLHGSRRDDPPAGLSAALVERMASDRQCTGCVLVGPPDLLSRMRRFCYEDCLTPCEIDVIAELDLSALRTAAAIEGIITQNGMKEELVNRIHSESSWSVAPLPHPSSQPSHLHATNPPPPLEARDAQSSMPARPTRHPTFGKPKRRPPPMSSCC